MQRLTVKSGGPGAPKAVPNPGSVSSVGPNMAAPKPRVKNTRDYGKAPMPGPATSPQPSPFGPGDSNSHLGGL